jgi:hypothetical protein
LEETTVKKILAILLATASVLSFAACKGKDEGVTDPADPNVFMSQQLAQEAEQSKALEEKNQAESKVQSEIDEYIEKVGKTKKNEQLVIKCKVPEHIGREYWKFEFKANGEFKSKTVYYFLPTLEQYNAKVEIGKDDKNTKVVDKDKEMKMVAIKSENATGKSFDKMYKNYTDQKMKDMGYIVIE